MACQSPFPNLPGTFESGSFRLKLNKFFGAKRITLIYKDAPVATFDAEDIVDLEEIVRRMSLFLTEESFAKLPPDRG